MTRVVVCLDGLDPEYLGAADTPNWDAIADAGSTGTCRCVVPSLTNVNNVSIVTGAFPETHGITGNSYYDPGTDDLVYMNDPSFLRCETRFQELAAAGESVAALVAKRKLERFVGRGCELALSAQDPPAWIEREVGEAPGIYSGEASRWLLDAALSVLEDASPDVLYVSTTDVVPHKHAPDEPEAREWVRTLDTRLGELVDRGVDLVATADHGMNHKSRRVDLDALLAEEGYDAEVVRLIRDDHTYHHQNLGGAAYVYLRGRDGDARGEADDGNGTDELGWLASVDGVDEVLSSTAAAERFGLPTDRIGDAMVLGTADSVFGPVEDGTATHDEVDLRSHGSVHEGVVPYVTTEDATLEHNLEAFDPLLGRPEGR
jgi:phosphonoacetate hydrolase